MVKKAYFISLLVLGLVFCQTGQKCFADAAFQLEQAEKYQDDGDYEQAEAIYRSVVTDYPNTGDALTAHARLAALYIAWDKQSEADAVYKQLLAKFSQQQGLPKALYTIAKAYERRKKYEQAGTLYQQVAQESSDAERIHKAQLHAAKVDVLSLIESANDTEAQAATDKLIEDFNDVDFVDTEEVPETLYDLARKYQGAEMYDQAKNLFQQIIVQYPRSRYTNKAQFDVEALNIFSLGYTANNADVNTAVDSFVAKFADHPYLPTAFYKIAVEYHMKAYQLVNKELSDQAEGCFQKAAFVFERVADEFPNAGEVPKALRSAGDCYRKLGEYEESIRCYKKVVDDYPDFKTAWNALFQIGRNYEDLKKSGAIAKLEVDAKIKAAYEQLLEVYPSCPGAKHARRWLSRYNSK